MWDLSQNGCVLERPHAHQEYVPGARSRATNVVSATTGLFMFGGVCPIIRNADTLYDQLGGKATLVRVHRTFYDKLYAHPWLKQFFDGVPRAVIESQQTDFMTSAFGGPEVYHGKFPVPAHQHMYITEEIFDLRHEMLEDSLIESGVSAELRARWLKVDGAFRGRMVKASASDCKGRYATEPIIVVPRPPGIRPPLRTSA